MNQLLSAMTTGSMCLSRALKIGIILVLMLVVILLFSGCSDPKVDQAYSQVNAIHARLDNEFDEKTGFFIKQEVKELDPWGRKIIVEYNTRNNYQTLTVRSAGIDGLPYTYDDIIVKSKRWKVGTGANDIKKILHESSSGVIEALREKK